MTEKEENEQTAVADTNADPKEGQTEDSGAAQDDGLDAILKEFDERKASKSEVQTSSEPSKTGTDVLDVGALAALEARLNAQEQKQQRDELEKVLNRMTEGVQADEIDAEAFLNAMARREPRLNDLYAKRNDNPKAWGKAEAAMKQEFQKRYGKKVDKQATESRDAVAAAVRSASTAAPQSDLTDKDIRDMSKDDFDEAQRKLGVVPV